MMDVVEVAYRCLMERLNEGGEHDFSFILEHHRAFLMRVQSGLFLTNAPALKRATDELLETVLAFCAHFTGSAGVANENLDPLDEILNDFGRQYTLFADLLRASKIHLN